ncbi:hypothetical protein L211DRAFT_865008 [Terfezia boudieri ATCC MYA-4762]|uniref:Uncharacterized protein n=1 Tax=Terfezia boudieri ATCC MYA-4762 TaxID=1051890 RepID=A0A3N4M028_9PEZI|nr:hypothetical protein L211DRAFT_865008 [Terfezia boudieri ATCC MYA-4762]
MIQSPASLSPCCSWPTVLLLHPASHGRMLLHRHSHPMVRAVSCLPALPTYCTPSVTVTHQQCMRMHEVWMYNSMCWCRGGDAAWCASGPRLYVAAGYSKAGWDRKPSSASNPGENAGAEAGKDRRKRVIQNSEIMGIRTVQSGSAELPDECRHPTAPSVP